MGEKWWNTFAPTNYTMSQSTHRPADGQSDVSSNSKNSTRTSPWRPADVDGFGLKHTAGPRSVCVWWGMGAPPAPTELLPGWSSANSTGPETKPPPSSHNRRERRRKTEGEHKNREMRRENKVRKPKNKSRGGVGRRGRWWETRRKGSEERGGDKAESERWTESGYHSVRRERDVGKQEEIRRLTKRMEHVTGCSRSAWKANGQK